MQIKTIDSIINYNPEKTLAALNRLKVNETISPPGSLSSDDTKLRKKRHTDLEDKMFIGQRQAAYDNSAGQLAPNKPVTANGDFFGGGASRDTTPDKQGIGISGDDHYNTDYRFAKANNSAANYNVEEVISRLKRKYGIDISNNQRAIDGIAPALRYQRSQMTRFDADQSMWAVTDNIARFGTDYYTDLENLDAGPEKPDSDYDALDPDGEISRMDQELYHRPTETERETEHAQVNHQKWNQMNENRWQPLFETNNTEYFVKHADELDPEAKADILKRRGETLPPEDLNKLTQHKKIAVSHNEPPKHDPSQWDKPVDENSAEGAPGGQSGILAYAPTINTQNSGFNIPDKFGTTGDDDCGGHIAQQDPSTPLKDNGWEEEANKPEREPQPVDEVWGEIPKDRVVIKNGWPYSARRSNLNTQSKRKRGETIKESSKSKLMMSITRIIEESEERLFTHAIKTQSPLNRDLFILNRKIVLKEISEGKYNTTLRSMLIK